MTASVALVRALHSCSSDIGATRHNTRSPRVGRCPPTWAPPALAFRTGTPRPKLDHNGDRVSEAQNNYGASVARGAIGVVRRDRPNGRTAVCSARAQVIRKSVYMNAKWLAASLVGPRRLFRFAGSGLVVCSAIRWFLRNPRRDPDGSSNIHPGLGRALKQHFMIQFGPIFRSYCHAPWTLSH